MVKKSNSGQTVFCLENIQRAYQTSKVEIQALRGINLLIYPTEFVALVGSSGSGKSTLMNILGLLDRPTKGKMFLDDKNVSDLTEDERAILRRDKIGFVFQSFNLLPRLTAQENVELPLIYKKISPSDRAQKAAEKLGLVGLSDRLNHLPGELSGGQQQRVAIARSLINDPEVILADEPTGNLDSHSGDEVMAVFKKLHQDGRTIIVVTHDQEIAAFAKRVVTVKDGLIIADKGQRDA
jgi:putative ABC transport system ATP-binding protein